MEVTGKIIAADGTPPVELKRWIELCGSHPNLRRLPPRRMQNPFRADDVREIPSRPDVAQLIVGDQVAGSLCWTQDEEEQVVYVTCTDAAALPVVEQLAKLLSAVFVSD